MCGLCWLGPSAHGGFREASDGGSNRLHELTRTLPHGLARHKCPPEWMLLRPRRDFERLLNPHALGSEDALLEAKEVAEAEA